MAGEPKVSLDEAINGYRIAEDVVSDKATMGRSKNKPFKGCTERSKNYGQRSYQKTRSSVRVANMSRSDNNTNGVSHGKRKMEEGISKHVQNPYVEQIYIAIEELNSAIGIQKSSKAGYEKTLQYVKEISLSYSSMNKKASDEVNNCRAQIEQIKAAVTQRTGSVFAEKICGLWQSGRTEDEESLTELFAREKSAISECVKKGQIEYEACRKKLEENAVIEAACKRNSDEKAADLEKIEGQIIGVNAAIAELQSALAVQEKYKKKMGSLRVSKKTKNGGYSLYPRPICHPLWATSDNNGDIIAINVSRCPVCNLGFEVQTLDIIVASCGHTFHPFCLVGDGKVLRRCPKCLCQMHEMWLKSFGVVEAGTSQEQPKNSEKLNASDPENTEELNASSQEAEMQPTEAEMQPAAEAESAMESSEESGTCSTLAQIIAGIKSNRSGRK